MSSRHQKQLLVLLAMMLAVASVACSDFQPSDSVPSEVEYEFPITDSFLVVGKEVSHGTSSLFIYSVEFVGIYDDQIVGDRTIERFRSSSVGKYESFVSACWIEAAIGEPLPDSCK